MIELKPSRSHGRRLLPKIPLLQAVTQNETARLMAIGMGIGIIAGVGAYLFDLISVGVGQLFLHTAQPSLDATVWWRRLLVPGGGALLVGAVVTHLVKTRRPVMVPDVIESVINSEARLSLQDSLTSAFCAAFSIGCGLSGGREGPIVQLGSSLGSRVCSFMNLSPSHARVLVAAGAAGGIAASFNTPLGGAFFALEVILCNFHMSCLGPVVAASVAGTAVGQALLGQRIALELPPFVFRHPAELLIYPVLGVLCSFVAFGFKGALLKSFELRARMRWPAPLITGIAGLLVGGLAATGFPQIMGNGYAFMEQLLGDSSQSVLFLLALLAIKGLATAITIGSAAGPGVFAPSLFIGALTGTLFGMGVHGIWPGLTESSGAYGMVGMGAVAAAVTYAPITMTLMLFEMTGNYAIIPPLLLTLAVSGVVSAYLDPESYYLSRLAQRGISVNRSREELVMHDLRVKDIMQRTDFRTIRSDASFQQLAESFLNGRVHEVYVVDSENQFHGLVDIQDIKDHLMGDIKGLVVADVETTRAPRLNPAWSLADAFPLFFRADLDELPVVDEGGELVGVLRERDIVGAYNREVLRKEALLARIEQGSPARRETRFLELPQGHVMDVVPITGQLVGHTLRELKLPQRFKVTVVAASIRDPKTGKYQRVPARADIRMREGDRIVVTGDKLDVMALQAADTDTEVTECIPKSPR